MEGIKGLFLDILFPRFCVGCGSFGKYICETCEKRINFYDPQTCPYCELPNPFGRTHPRCETSNCLDGMFVLAHYQGIIPRIIHNSKYKSHYAELTDVADLINKKFHNVYKFNYFVPVPLSKKRQEERGFNQARKLGEYLCRLQSTGYRLRQNYKTVVDILVRSRETKPQFDLKYDQRKQNVKDAFALNPELITNNLTGHSFCLIDDVATTGATIFECAKVLKKNGAKEVFAICIARGG